jgi:HEAT repeat protein
LAIQALGALGKESGEVVPILVDSLKDEVVEVRLAALEELGNLGPKAKTAEPAVKASLRDPRKSVRDAAEETLKKIQAAP